LSKSKFVESLREAWHRLLNVFRGVLAPLLDVLRRHRTTGVQGANRSHLFAYRVLGKKTARFLPLFKDVDVNLLRSGMKTSFRAYVNLAVFFCLLLSLATLVLVPCILSLFFRVPALFSVLFGIGASLFVGALVIVAFYIYPIYRADSLKRAMEDGLPFTTGYMAILAGAGVPPASIIRSLAWVDATLPVSIEARTIVRDMELFGADLLSALESSSKRTPSSRFKELLEGFISTVHSGGNLTKYLMERSRQFMRLKRIKLKRFADTLGVLAEFYVALLVAGSLILVVMLAVMAMLGGSGQGLFNPRLLLYILTYIGIPIGSIVFLILLDMISPRR